MIRTLTITAALLAASLTSAMADGVEDTLSVIGMAIAENECGLKPDPYIAQQTAQKSMAYTGLSRAVSGVNVGRHRFQDQAALR